MALTDPRLLAAIQRYGPSLNDLAAHYVNPVNRHRLSGTGLLAKLVQGESGGRPDAISSAGARGLAQFMPGSRQAAIEKFGVDPWADPDQAVHAAALHLQGKITGSAGLRGYNPGGGQGYVDYILGQRVGSAGSARAATGGARVTPTAQGAPAPGQPDPAAEPGGTGLAALLEGLVDQRQAPPMGQLETPQFSSEQYLPSAGPVPVSSGGPQPKTSLTDTLSAISALVGPDSPQATQTPGQPPGSPQNAAGGLSGAHAQLGTVRIAPGANRAGANLTPGILRVVRAVAGAAGKPLTIGTGTNHPEYTVNGNVSDHWSGNAVDIPSAGRDLTTLGRQALIAAGMDPKQAAKAKGGIYNIPYGKKRRIQVIFNTNEGGNHFNHLHVGVTGLR